MRNCLKISFKSYGNLNIYRNFLILIKSMLLLCMAAILLSSCSTSGLLEKDILYEFEKIPKIRPEKAEKLCQESEKKILAKKYKEAVFLCHQVIRSTKNPLLLGKAHYLIGLAYQKLGNFEESLKYYRIVERKYAESKEARLALEGIYEIGSAWIHGRQKSFLFFFTSEDREKGVEILKNLVEKYPYLRSSDGKLLADDIYFSLGELYYKWEDYIKARAYYQKVLDLYKEGEWKDLAAYKIAMSYLQERDLPEYDQSSWKNARKKFEEYLVRFPKGDYAQKAREWIQQINEALAGQDYRIGEYYYDQDQPLAAAIYFLAVTKEYKDTKTANICRKRLEEPWAKKALEKLKKTP